MRNLAVKLCKRIELDRAHYEFALKATGAEPWELSE